MFTYEGEICWVVGTLSAEVRVHEMQLSVTGLIPVLFSVLNCVQKQDLCVIYTPFSKRLFRRKRSK